jgi:riboflavin kinase/FMN adenylyltransferase
VILHTDINQIHLNSPVVTLGMFDGVHRGHQKLLSAVKAEAARRGTESLAVTFWPHPRLVLGTAGPGFKLLSTLDEKVQKISQAGMDHLLVIPFSESFAGVSGKEFVEDWLCGKLRAGLVVAGDEIRFGSGGSGNADLLRKYATGCGFELMMLETHLHGEQRISSTFIRECLRAGDLSQANSLLGYNFELTGTVASGNRIGNTIGFPTANINIGEDFKQIPSDGVYAVIAETSSGRYRGMLNIGVRPTLQDEGHQTIEVHMFGAQGDFYGDRITVKFVERLRDEMKFGSLDELKEQLEKDKEAAMKCITFAIS